MTKHIVSQKVYLDRFKKMKITGTEDIVEGSESMARKIQKIFRDRGFKVRVMPFYEGGLRLFQISVWDGGKK